jgi:CheY-like chemotaxis protein
VDPIFTEAGSGSYLMTPKILVVDDEPDMVITCVRLLKAMGYRCLTARTGPEAIHLVNAEHPDVVVTDLNLSVGDGFEISRHVRRSLPQTPVIVLTAYHTPDTVGAAYASGATGYLAKPFSTADFKAAIQRALGLIPP